MSQRSRPPDSPFQPHAVVPMVASPFLTTIGAGCLALACTVDSTRDREPPMEKLGLTVRVVDREAAEFQHPRAVTSDRPYVFASVAISGAGATFAGLWALERRRRLAVARAMESQFTALTQLERRAAVGELTAAITHELGQPIATILRNAEAAEMILTADYPALQKLKEIVADIRTSDKRAHELIQRLRAVLKNQPLEFYEIDLEQVITESLGLAAPLASERGVT